MYRAPSNAPCPGAACPRQRGTAARPLASFRCGPRSRRGSCRAPAAGARTTAPRPRRPSRRWRAVVAHSRRGLSSTVDALHPQVMRSIKPLTSGAWPAFWSDISPSVHLRNSKHGAAAGALDYGGRQWAPHSTVLELLTRPSTQSEGSARAEGCRSLQVWRVRQ